MLNCYTILECVRRRILLVLFQVNRHPFAPKCGATSGSFLKIMTAFQPLAD